MFRKIRFLIRDCPKEERGYAFILVLILLLLGGLLISALLYSVGTGLKTGQIYERKTGELYATDAGIEDAIWRIGYGRVSELTDPEPYDPYNYDAEWQYELTQELNDNNVSVVISNIWIPENLAIPTQSEAQEIVDARKLMVNGTKTGICEYRIRISFVPENEEERNNMNVTSIGIWLPFGYHYDVSVPSNLEEPLAEYNSVPFIQQYGGGEAVIWEFSPSIQFSKLPPAGSTETAIIEFEYTTEPRIKRDLETLSWVTTTGQVENAEFAWDVDTKVYAIKSTAGDTQVDSVVYLVSRYSGLFDNAITSPGDISLAPGTFVQGNVQYNGELDNKGIIDGEEITDEIDWPDTQEWQQFFLNQVTAAPDPGGEIDLIDYAVGDYLGPFYRIGWGGDLDIDNTGDAVTVKLAFGAVIYITGDLRFMQSGTGREYVIDMNWGTIFVEGNIDFPPQNVGLKGSGCIIAIGDINFQPEMVAEPDNYILVCSLEGFNWFKPQGDFYGSIAGRTYCDLNPNGQLIWTAAPGMLNVPGSGSGPGNGGFAHTLTKYIWNID